MRVDRETRAKERWQRDELRRAPRRAARMQRKMLGEKMLCEVRALLILMRRDVMSARGEAAAGGARVMDVSSMARRRAV